jgi:hypothetical protein
MPRARQSVEIAQGGHPRGAGQGQDNSIARARSPVLPTRVYEGDELRGAYATRLRRGGRNSNSKAKPPVQSRNVISSSGTTWNAL